MEREHETLIPHLGDAHAREALWSSTETAVSSMSLIRATEPSVHLSLPSAHQILLPRHLGDLGIDVDLGHIALAVSPRTIRRILAEAAKPFPGPAIGASPESPGADAVSRMLVQVDGSRHDWLEGRGPTLTLIGAIDNATGIVAAATFRKAEDAAGCYLEVFGRTLGWYGRPMAIYFDRHRRRPAGHVNDQVEWSQLRGRLE